LYRYAAGATIQVLLFSVLAVEIKRKCPAIHTVLEIVLARWGTAAHLVFLFFCCITNMIVTAMLILGGLSSPSHMHTHTHTSSGCQISPHSDRYYGIEFVFPNLSLGSYFSLPHTRF
jgi:Na+/proline symporter